MNDSECERTFDAYVELLLKDTRKSSTDRCRRYETNTI
jgi:hypothetical protein